MSEVLRLEVYRRRTIRTRGRKLWGWRAVTANGRIIATDGGQGYANRGECETVAWKLLHGKYHVEQHQGAAGAPDHSRPPARTTPLEEAPTNGGP